LTRVDAPAARNDEGSSSHEGSLDEAPEVDAEASTGSPIVKDREWIDAWRRAADRSALSHHGRKLGPQAASRTITERIGRVFSLHRDASLPVVERLSVDGRREGSSLMTRSMKMCEGIDGDRRGDRSRKQTCWMPPADDVEDESRAPAGRRRSGSVKTVERMDGERRGLTYRPQSAPRTRAIPPPEDSGRTSRAHKTGSQGCEGSAAGLRGRDRSRHTSGSMKSDDGVAIGRRLVF
jgi:hypothetical protein